MARKRYLKPGFFKNEDLAELSFEYRLLFQGLWCWADREGRLEDRPKRLKSEIFPYDNVDVNAGLNYLQEKGFIIRYKVDNDYIQITNFKLHQDVHVKEQVSTIPAHTPVLHGASTGNSGTSPSLNLVLGTSTLNLEPVLVEEVLSEREIEIETAVEEWTLDDAIAEHRNGSKKEEKEKNSAKKEILTVVQAMESIIERCPSWWRNVVEHILKPPKTTLTPELTEMLDTERRGLFKIFYETKEDNYRIRYPTFEDIASNFYYWTKIYKSKEFNTLKQNATTKPNTGNSGSKNRTAANEERSQIAAKSAEFLSGLTG